MKRDKLEIHEPNAEDSGQVILLLRQLWPDRELDKKKLEEVFSKGLTCDQQEYLAAAYLDDIAGSFSPTIISSLWQEGNIGRINEMIVDERFRGKGIGTIL